MKRPGNINKERRKKRFTGATAAAARGAGDYLHSDDFLLIIIDIYGESAAVVVATTVQLGGKLRAQGRVQLFTSPKG